MTRANLFRQTLGLWNRNVLLKWRNKKQTLQEFLLPVGMVLFLAVLRLTIVTPGSNPAIPSFPKHSMQDSSFASPLVGAHFYLSPNEASVTNILTEALDLLGFTSPDIQSFNSSTIAEQFYRENASAEGHSIVGVDFVSYWSGNDIEHAEYVIRMPFLHIASTQNKYAWGGGCREPGGLGYCSANDYIHSGFVALQRALDTILMKRQTGESSFPPPDVSVQLYPKDEWTPDLVALQAIVSIYFVFAYSSFVNFMVVNLVAEKENKIKEGMRMMGMRDAAFWLSWGLTYAAIILVVSIICTIVARFAMLFSSSSMFLILLILLLYGLTIITLSFAVTPFFNKAETAGGYASFATIIFSLLYLAVSLTREGYNEEGPVSSIPASGQWALCLLSPVAMALAIDQALYLDVSHGGLQFSNLHMGQFPVYASMTMLAVDFLLYGLMAIYFDNVVPSEYGQRRPPHYFLLPSYWCPRKKTESEMLNLIENAQGPLTSPTTASSTNRLDLEGVPQEMRDKNVLRIFNIHKTYKTKKKKVPTATLR